MTLNSNIQCKLFIVWGVASEVNSTAIATPAVLMLVQGLYFLSLDISGGFVLICTSSQHSFTTCQKQNTCIEI